jgi:uncharacterized protein HemY
MSLIEAVANIVIGFWISVAANYVIMPWFGYNVSVSESIWIAVAFTFVSLVRSYVLRRIFNSFR